jgi:hypothetical protein
MTQQHRSSLRILFGVCLVLTLCLRGNAASSNRPSRGGSRGSTSSASSRSRSTLDDEFLDLDNDTNNFLFDDDNDVGYGLDGQDDLDYPADDDLEGIDFSEGDEDDFDRGGNGVLDDYVEEDGDGQQSSSTEKGALYDAYNLLHSLAQVSFFSLSLLFQSDFINLLMAPLSLILHVSFLLVYSLPFDRTFKNHLMLLPLLWLAINRLGNQPSLKLSWGSNSTKLGEGPKRDVQWHCACSTIPGVPIPDASCRGMMGLRGPSP